VLFIGILASNSPVRNYFRYEKHKPHPGGALAQETTADRGRPYADFWRKQVQH